MAPGANFFTCPAEALNPTSKDTIAKRMHYVHQDGQQVFKFAVRKQTELCLKLLERNGLTGSDIDVFIPHQANLRIINATADRLGLRPESIIINIDRYGNTTAGTIPLAMNTAIEEGKCRPRGRRRQRNGTRHRGPCPLSRIHNFGRRLIEHPVIVCLQTEFECGPSVP